MDEKCQWNKPHPRSQQKSADGVAKPMLDKADSAIATIKI